MFFFCITSLRHTFTPKSKDKLLCWIFAIALTLENFNMDASAMTRDMSLKQTKVNELFKSLGCKVNELSASERAQKGVGAEEAKGMKRAILTVPLTFPLPKRYVNVSFQFEELSFTGVFKCFILTTLCLSMGCVFFFLQWTKGQVIPLHHGDKPLLRATIHIDTFQFSLSILIQKHIDPKKISTSYYLDLTGAGS